MAMIFDTAAPRSGRSCGNSKGWIFSLGDLKTLTFGQNGGWLHLYIFLPTSIERRYERLTMFDTPKIMLATGWF